jgi:hypothetical protein
MEDVERQVALEALGRLQAEQEADPAAPVVADELHALDSQCVEDGERVVGEVLLLVAGARRVRPAEASLVEGQHAMAVREGRQQVSPLVPVLRPAVQAEDDILAGAHFGDVEVEPAGAHPAVGDAIDVRWTGHLANLSAPLH